MPPFLLPAFLLPGWGAFYGDDRLFFNPLDRLGMDPGRWPGCFPAWAVWAAWAAFFSRWGATGG